MNTVEKESPLRKLNQKIQTIAQKYPRVTQILLSPDLRTNASLYFSSGMSLIFTLFCFISGLFGNTRWFMTLGVYNFVLTFLRLIPAIDMRRQLTRPLPADERIRHDARISQIIGILLLILNLAFIGIISETIIRDHAFHYHPLVMFFMVPFTLINFIIISVDAFRHRREGMTLAHTLRVINMNLGLISLYTMQTAVLHTYVSRELLRFILNLTTSSLIFIAMIRINIRLILTARKALKTTAESAQ